MDARLVEAAARPQHDHQPEEWRPGVREDWPPPEPVRHAVGNVALASLAPCACGGGGGGCGCPEEPRLLQRKGLGPAPAVIPRLVTEVLRTAAQPLRPQTLLTMSRAFGHDFSGVRVHTDHAAAASASALNAAAYTVGSDIVFAWGRYAPGEDAGNRLLAHELAHVVQQSGASAATAADAGLGIESPGQGLETEADRASAAAAAGDQAPALSRGPARVARQQAAVPERSWWQRTRERAYSWLINSLQSSIDEAIRIERDYASTVPLPLRPIVEVLIDVHRETATIGMDLVLAIVSLVGGFITGIAQLVEGLARIILGLGHLILAVLQDLIAGSQLTGRWERTEAWLTDFWNTLKAIPSGVKQLVTTWLAEFRTASTERQVVMIGEIFGQIEALIASVGAAASRGGTVAEVAGAGGRTATTGAEAAAGGAEVTGRTAEVISLSARAARTAAAAPAEAASGVRVVGNVLVREAAETAPAVSEAAPLAARAPAPVLRLPLPKPAIAPAPAPPVVPTTVPALTPAAVRVGRVAAVGAGVASELYQAGESVQPKPAPEPAPKKKPRRKECRFEPCEYPLPISWPTELPYPEPSPRGLERTPKGELEWQGIDRAAEQSRLAAEIRANREALIPPPRPCFPDDAEPNQVYDAHHRHPLFLGGEEAEYNLCALANTRHVRGHPRLNDQREHLDEYIECGICSPLLSLHPSGQTYEIVEEK